VNLLKNFSVRNNCSKANIAPNLAPRHGAGKNYRQKAAITKIMSQKYLFLR
jgi:hypothetical protein